MTGAMTSMRGRGRWSAAIAAAAWLAGAPAFARPLCAGDCDAGGTVEISELVSCITAGLEPSPASCPACDADGDGTIAVSDVVVAVAHARDGCPAGAGPTPTPTATPPFPAAPPDRLPRLCGAPGQKSCRARAPASSASVPCPSPQSVSADVEQEGTTDGGSSVLSGVTCGTRGGGAGAPERVYDFVAPLAGDYDVRVEGRGFSPLLSVRRGTCQGAFVGCAVDARQGRPSLSVSAAAGEHLAIVVDGNGSGQQGPFRLRVAARRPDLVVRIVSAPANGFARRRIEVAAEVENLGNADAGPFAVNIGLAQDALLNVLLGGESTGCGFAGLAAGASVVCQPFNTLILPSVLPGAYFLGARVDSTDAVAESDETNNRDARAFQLVSGITVTNQVFRANDGAVYQIVQGRPNFQQGQSGNGAEEVILTSFVGARFLQVGEQARACTTESGQGVPGDPIAAVAGAPQGIGQFLTIMRTGVLPVDDIDAVTFDASFGGRLTLGTGETAITVCEGTPGCNTSAIARLRPLGQESGHVPRACFARLVAYPASCGGGTVNLFAFDLPSGGDFCTEPAPVTTQAPRCQRRPVDGVTLAPGEVIVLRHGANPAFGYSTAFAGFAIDTDGVNPFGCPPDSIVTGNANVNNLAPVAAGAGSAAGAATAGGGDSLASGSGGDAALVVREIPTFHARVGAGRSMQEGSRSFLPIAR